MKRWALYRRISDGEQTYGYSMEAQLADAERFVKDYGGVIVAMYDDQYTGRRTDGRIAFQRMIDDSARGLFDAVLVHKFDRFARNRKDSVVYKAVLKKMGINVFSVLEPTDLESPASVLFEGMLEVYAEFFSANLAQEVRKGLAMRAKNGLHTGLPAYGYKMTDGMLEPTDDLSSVKLAIDTYLTGVATDMDIVRLLNHDGPKMRKQDGSLGRFTRDAVRYILTNPVYAGFIRYNGQLIEGKHKAIITVEQFQAILRLRDRFYHGPRQNRRSPRHYPFTRIMRCGHCGGPMSSSYSPNNGPTRMTYRCSDRGTGKSDCNQPSIPAAIVDSAVLDTFRYMRLPTSILEQARSLTDAVQESRRVSAERQALEERLRRARILYLDDAISDGEWRREKERIERALHILPKASAMVPQSGCDLDQFAALPLLWQAAEASERKALARLLIQRMVVDGRSVSEIELTNLGHTLRLAATTLT